MKNILLAYEFYELIGQIKLINAWGGGAIVWLEYGA